MTVAMILTTAISIGLFGGGLLVVRLADHSRAIYLDRVETQVFLDNDISANDANCTSPPCKALREKIEKRNDVKSVRFLNRQDAYDDAIRKIPQFKDLASKDAFPVEAMVAATAGVIIAIVGLMVVRALFLDNALSQFYQAHLIAPVDYADILYISPLLLLVGVAMAAVTAYATLRLYVRR